MAKSLNPKDVEQICQDFKIKPGDVLKSELLLRHSISLSVVKVASENEKDELLWQKLDPAIGSCLVFLLPCVMLAALSPFMTRMMSRQLAHVGRTSGRVFAISTAGSIAGVFTSGYVLIDHMKLSSIFRMTGALTIGLGLACWVADRWFRGGAPANRSEPPCEG